MKAGEKTSSYDFVVGKISDEQKIDILDYFAYRFVDQSFDELKGIERPKTEAELTIIKLTNVATNDVRNIYGLENFDIPPENVHVIREEKWHNVETNGGFTPLMQAVTIREPKSLMQFAHTMVHEMLHFKSYHAIQNTSEDIPFTQDYRGGLTVTGRSGRDLRLVELNEAVTEELTWTICEQLFRLPLFEEDRERTQEVKSLFPWAADDDGGQFFTNETFYAEIRGETGLQRFKRRLDKSDKRPYPLSRVNYSYGLERYELFEMIKEIAGDNPESIGDIFDTFARSYLTGNLLAVARIVDGYYGKGTLRKIGSVGIKPALLGR